MVFRRVLPRLRLSLERVPSDPERLRRARAVALRSRRASPRRSAARPPRAGGRGAGRRLRRSPRPSAAIAAGASAKQLRLEHLRRRHHDRALDGVLQLAHVARPGVASPAPSSLARGMRMRAARVAAAVDLGEVPGERRGSPSRPALAQGRQHDLDDAHAVEEVLPELARAPRARRGRGASRRGCARRPRASRARPRARTPAPGGTAAAWTAPTSGRSPISSSSSVPPCGQLHLAADAPVGARERAALVAEELTLGEGAGQRGAVEDDERLVLALRVDVDGAREEPLADAGLAAKKHRRVRRRRRAGSARRRGASRARRPTMWLNGPRRLTPRVASGEGRSVVLSNACATCDASVPRNASSSAGEGAALLVEHLHDAADGALRLSMMGAASTLRVR